MKLLPTYKIKIMFIVLFFSLFLWGSYTEQACSEERVVPYNLHLFTANRTLDLPLNGESYWIELKPHLTISGTCFIELHYSYSETLKEDRSIMTVFLNGLPLTSKVLTDNGAGVQVWRVELPSSMFKTGFNEIRVATTQRSIEGLCKDIDNPSNWVVLYADSLLHIETVVKDTPLIKDFPHPFLDYLANHPADFDIILPDKPAHEYVESMLNVMGNFGRMLPTQNLYGVKVYSGKYADTSRNAIIIGDSKVLNQKLSKKPKGTAIIMLNKTDQSSQLLLTGTDINGVEKGIAVMSNDGVRSQINDNFYITDKMPYSAANTLHTGIKGLFNLKNFKISMLKITGPFHQKVGFSIIHPASWKVGKGSYLELHLRHSPILKPERSAITVYINGIPAKTVALDATNTENGVVQVEVPESELNRSWQVDIACYHDLGTIDCSKRYDEIAWTIVEDSSLVYFAPGEKKIAPDLASFPALNSNPDGSEETLSVILPDNPSDAILELASGIAGRAAQNAGGKLDFKVSWISEVVAGKFKPSGNIVLLSSADDASKLGIRLKGLPVKPLGKGKYFISDQINLVPAYFDNRVMLEAGKSPYDEAMTIYTVFVANDDEALIAERFIADNELSSQLDGQVSLLSADGKVQVYYIAAVEENDLQDGKLSAKTVVDFFAGPNTIWRMYLLMVGLVLAGIAFSIYIGRKIEMRKKRV